MTTPLPAPPVEAAGTATDLETMRGARVLAAQVGLLYDRNLPAALFIVPFTLLTSWFLWATVRHELVIGWLISKVIAASALVALDRGYRRRGTVENAPSWGRWYAGVLAFDGLSWSFMGFGLVPADRIDLLASMTAAIVGAASLGVLAQAVYSVAAFAFVLPLVVPVIVWHLLRADPAGTFWAAGLAGYLALVVHNVRQTSQATKEMLRLRYELAEVAEQRAEALVQAQRHSAVKSQFLATMSHEMRTPLHGILGTVRLMRDEVVPPTHRERLDLVERSGQHLLELINDILDFSRSEAGQLQLVSAPFDLRSTLRDIVDLSAGSASAKGLQLHLDSPFTGAAWQTGDAKRVRQVLINLVGNAVKFTDAGSVSIVVRHDGGRVRIEVRDTGIGIPADELARVFQPFQQVDSSYARQYDGTGLGLTISRELARAMGGDITCESTPGAGSTFTLGLPWKPCDAPPAASGPDATTAPVAGLTGHVLLAEDNAVNVLVARAMLEALGLEVTVAGDGAEATARYLERRPAVVLMDCHMPGVDGFEATQRIRAEESGRGLPRVPIIAVTANALADDRARCLDAGMDDYLAKPFTVQDLRAMLGKHLAAPADRSAV